MAVLLLLAPVAGATLLHSPADETGDPELRRTATNVTFISTQGGSTDVYPHAGVLVAVHTDSKRVIWRHDRYRRYMDVDPLDRDRVLFVAGQRYENGTVRRFAVVMNWRTGEELRRFEVPPDTHDVDHLGGDRYVVADKFNPRPDQRRREGRVYVFDASNREVLWEYDFIDDFPPYPEAGGQATGYTHLNDVDSVDNGTAFLVSPRNFDRVMAIDRSTKEVRWTLGEEDNYGILHEQHNPTLLERDPLTVLVADSENDRVIEYQLWGGRWEPLWAYTGGLSWPRDADRLPNGNTLITDSANDRVIEVTPDRRVVWEFTIARAPYDAERLPYGDEPGGPSMAEFRSEFDTAIPARGSSSYASVALLPFRESYNSLYQLVGAWVLPPGAGRGEFVWVLLAAILGVTWAGAELALRLPMSWIQWTARTERIERGVSLFGSLLGLALGFGCLFLLPASGDQTSFFAAVGISLLNIGTSLADRTVRRSERFTDPAERLLSAAKFGLSAGSVAIAGLLVASPPSEPTELVLFVGLALVVLLSAVGLWEGGSPAPP